ncbi:MAG: Gfo/Idh/MocA family oxidoreductase [Lachnospiraceae bacterium]|nr:Gfo/Idh/MocA family oxidoreductase [Lachnospiraceae bacterium]
MEKVRWGVLGTANIAKNCTIPGMKMAENCHLAAIAGRNPDKARAFKEEFGFEKSYGSYDELLNDDEVEAVYIPLPNGMHLQWVKAALEKKKHVLCEKPLALNSADAAEMFRTAEENGVFLMEAYAYLHSSYVESLKNEIKGGIIGNPVFIRSSFITQGYSEDIRLHRDQGGGAMYDLGCYCTTMILSLTDSDPVFVKASSEFSDEGVDMMTSAVIRFENGIRASFDVGMILGTDTDARYDSLYIYGEKGSIRSDVEYNQDGDVNYRIYTDNKVTEKKLTVKQNYCLETEQLGRCILNGEKPLVSPEFSIRNSKLMDSIFAETGYYDIRKK